jgi:hypothetical protein
MGSGVMATSDGAAADGAAAVAAASLGAALGAEDGVDVLQAATRMAATAAATTIKARGLERERFIRASPCCGRLLGFVVIG